MLTDMRLIRNKCYAIRSEGNRTVKMKGAGWPARLARRKNKATSSLLRSGAHTSLGVPFSRIWQRLVSSLARSGRRGSLLCDLCYWSNFIRRFCCLRAFGEIHRLSALMIAAERSTLISFAGIFFTGCNPDAVDKLTKEKLCSWRVGRVCSILNSFSKILEKKPWDKILAWCAMKENVYLWKNTHEGSIEKFRRIWSAFTRAGLSLITLFLCLFFTYKIR